MLKNGFYFSLLILSIICFTNKASAQYYRDALRYSQTTFGGTARTQGFGGASVAIGGDLSNAITNPAGLGFNRRSEIIISPAIGFNNTNSNYYTYPGNPTESTTDSRFNFNFGSLGAIFSKARNGMSSNFGGSFAISVSRINDFNNSITYRGTNDSTQLVDSFLQQADGVSWDELDQQGENGVFDYLGLAYFTYLIGPNYDDPQNFDNYTTPIAPPQEFPTFQQEQITTKGAQYEWNFSYGGNYDDKIYYGLGIGVQTINYTREREYRESVSDGSSPFSELIYLDRLTHNGIGVNFKAGLIYRASDKLRFGLSGVTPTWYRLNEVFDEELYTYWNNVTIFDGYNSDGTENYTLLTNFSQEALYDEIYFSLKTPARINGGVAYFFGKNGFVTADIEYLNYGSTRLNNPRYAVDGYDAGFDFDGDNEVTKDIYKSIINFRVGGEYRMDMLRFRGGFAYYGDPYAADDRLGNDVMSFTVGTGLRKKDFYTDLAVVANTYTSEVRPYQLYDYNSGQEVNPVATVKQSRVRAIFTVGLFY
ncbi:MAG: hypothetical protein CMO01_23490 [Thalassobius sp.]|nr:hypothetical protein [Thalassovita sp.]